MLKTCFKQNIQTVLLKHNGTDIQSYRPHAQGSTHSKATLSNCALECFHTTDCKGFVRASNVLDDEVADCYLKGAHSPFTLSTSPDSNTYMIK